MRSIIHVLKISLLAGCFALLTVTPTATAAYNESGGVVVMEAESEPLPAQGWKQATSVVGRSDNASIFGSFYGSTLNSSSTPGKGLISYKVVITTPGDYQLQWRSLISSYNSTEGTFNTSTETTEHNDSFARMLNPSGVSITAQEVPGGANGGVPDKIGSASENWYKVYRNGSGWIWDAKNQDNYPLPLFWTLAPGTYTFQISARSSGHAIDRILLWNRNGSTSYGNKVTGAGNTSASNALPLSVITGTDTTAPTISSFSPADNATAVVSGANLVATFSENISRGTGNITVKNLTDATQTTIAVTDTSQVSISGAVLTINPTANLVAGKNHAIQIAATAIDDTAGNSFAGITNDTTWNFATEPAYDAWARGALFDADANGDGVKNGLAWILGAANPTASVLDKLPTVSTVGGNMVFTFQRIQSSISATTALSIEVGTTLTSWPSIYTVGANTAGSTGGVEVAKDTPTAGTDRVKLTVLQAPDAAKFARLKAVQTP
ncbi:Ig-like domain-containing protein [Luteolibacter arcticus]|uniref:Ig-like domain-containing protein n=1 Tax=Luteolibacter arcticus TaxID=1581411 RepID=A0ABT3GJJ0_9BACT|nr:Ig-like domain-containing protein [Luteolibacter arcticus]MCW1923685.1 Ig-like domain-containing protein [Luteolibacter arcticus]